MCNYLKSKYLSVSAAKLLAALPLNSNSRCWCHLIEERRICIKKAPEGMQGKNYNKYDVSE